MLFRWIGEDLRNDVEACSWETYKDGSINFTSEIDTYLWWDFLLKLTEDRISSLIWFSQQVGPQTSSLSGINRLRYILPSFPFIKPSVNCIVCGPHWVKKCSTRITFCWGVTIVWLPPQYRLQRWSLNILNLSNLSYHNTLHKSFEIY